MNEGIEREIKSIRIHLKRIALSVDEIRFGYMGITALMVVINITLLLILIFK